MAKKNELMETPKLQYYDIIDCLNEYNQKAASSLQNVDFDMLNGSVATFITTNIIKPLPYFEERRGERRTANELKMAFKGFKILVSYINEKCVYTPTLNTFCMYICCSTKTFKSMTYEESERGEIANEIKECIEETLLQNMLSGKTHPITSMFVAKANMGMRDNDNANVNILNVNGNSRSVDEILAEFNKNKLEN